MKSVKSNYETLSLDIEDMGEQSFSPLRLETALLIILSVVLLLLTATTASLSSWRMLPYVIVILLTGCIGKKGEKLQSEGYVAVYVHFLSLLCLINLVMTGYRGYDIYKQFKDPCVPSDFVV